MYIITVINYYLLFIYFVILFIEILHRDYPDKYQKLKSKLEQIRNNLLYNILYTYSKCQIVYGKFSCFLLQFANENGLLIKNIQNDITQVSYGKIVTKNFTHDKDTHFEDVDNSFYIYSDNKNANGKKCINKIISRTQQFNTNYEASNVKFILVEVKIDDKNFKVELKTDESNYYIINNIFDKNFFIYYLQYYRLHNLSKEDVEKIDKLSVKLIDHNVNIVNLEITDKHYIVIEKDSYIYTKQ